MKLKSVLAALISTVILSACATQISDEELRLLVQSEVLLAIEEIGPQLVGSEGPQGRVGERGIQGEPGSKGEPGLQGETGPQGEPGIQGVEGDPGQRGPEGDKGEQGSGIALDGISTLPALTVKGLTVTDQDGIPIIHLGSSTRFIGPELTMTVPGAPDSSVNLTAGSVGASLRFGERSEDDSGFLLMGKFGENNMIRLGNTEGGGIDLNLFSGGASRITMRDPNGIRVLFTGLDESGVERIVLLDNLGNLTWSAP